MHFAFGLAYWGRIFVEKMISWSLSSTRIWVASFCVCS
jgi:hypothetical protein